MSVHPPIDVASLAFPGMVVLQISREVFCYGSILTLKTLFFHKVLNRLFMKSSAHSRFLTISGQEYLFFIEAFCWVVLCQLAVLLPFRRLVPYLGRKAACSPEKALSAETQKTVFNVTVAISRAVYYTPWEVKCLVQAMAGKFMLKHRKIESTLYLGVTKSGENQIKAHAWLRCGNQVVCGEQGMYKYTVLSRFVG